MVKIIYQGFFVDEKSSKLLKEKEGLHALEKDTLHKHVTFEFRPNKKFRSDLMNKEFTFKVIGYANNGENSGFEVVVPKELLPYYKGSKVPHITTSTSQEGKPKNTALLSFERFQEKDVFFISGKIGCFTTKGTVDYNCE